MKCNKIPYRDKISAMMALATCRKGRSGARAECRIYRCPICKSYHLTSQQHKCQTV